MNLTGSAALVTRGTSGIGRALARRLHRMGSHVVIAGRHQHLLDEIVAAHPGIHGILPNVDEADALHGFSCTVCEKRGDM